MVYLFFQIWVWLVIAFALGWFAHWFFCCRGKDDSGPAKTSGLTSTINDTQLPDVAVDDEWKPLGMLSPPDRVDDLKRIKGVGLVIEETLNELGIYQFEQIAQWSENNIAWVEHSLSFPGRIEREDWVNQARTLSDGGTTEFAKRVDKGDVEYD